MASEDDPHDVERLLEQAATQVTPQPPSLSVLDARVRSALRRRRFGAGALGVAAASVALVPAVLLPSLGGDSQPQAPVGQPPSFVPSNNPGQPSGSSSSATVSSSPSTSPGGTSVAKDLDDLCRSATTLVFRDTRGLGNAQGGSLSEAARRWRLPGEQVRLLHSPDESVAFAVFQPPNKPPRQVLRLAYAHSLWAVTRTAACLDPRPENPGCGQAVEFRDVNYENIPPQRGVVIGVGSLTGQGRMPVCAREPWGQGRYAGPRGPVAPVGVWQYPEEPVSYGVTISIAHSPAPSELSVRVYQPQ